MFAESKNFSYLIYCENPNATPSCEEYFRNKNNIPQYFTDDNFNQTILTDCGWVKNEYGEWMCKSCATRKQNLKRKN